MTDWKKMDNYHMKNGEWTISKSHSPSSIYPYGLHHNATLHGHFKTLKEAQAKHGELVK